MYVQKPQGSQLEHQLQLSDLRHHLQVEIYVQMPSGNQLEFQPRLLYLRHYVQQKFRTRLMIQYLQWEASNLNRLHLDLHKQKALFLYPLVNALMEEEETKYSIRREVI